MNLVQDITGDAEKEEDLVQYITGSQKECCVL